MERLDSLNPGLAIPAGGTLQRSLTAKGMQANRWVDKFFLKMTLTLGRGAGAIAHVPQAISEIVNRLTISHGRMNWSVPGRVIHLFDMLQRMTINSMSPQLAAAETEYVFYLPIDPSPSGPPYHKANLFRTSELQNCVLDFIFTNPFDAVNDVTGITANVELWVSYAEAPNEEQKEWVSLFRFQDDFEGNVVSINDMIPVLWVGLGESPTDFDVATIESTGPRIARNADMIDLDARDYYYQGLQPLDAANLTLGGDQFLRDVPRANAPAENYHKIFDGRNDPDAGLPIVINYNSKPNNFAYAVKGVGI